MKINESVIIQKDYRIPDELNLFDYFHQLDVEEDFTDPNTTICIAVLNGEIFEFNVMGSLILEGIQKMRC